jgi:phage shock protein C
MQRIIQINIAGRMQPIEEDAYLILKDYISALERQFTGDDGKEIIEDIEARISELFTIRLQSGSPAIDRADVQKVIDTLGSASDLNDGSQGQTTGSSGGNDPFAKASSSTYSGYNRTNQRQRRTMYQNDRLVRDPYNKVLGGVCSGIAHYFDIDPVIIRLILVVLLLTFGVGVIAYIIAWIVIPEARSRAELYYENPMTFHDISRNMSEELDDLKRRGEQMSRELREFFSKKR